MKWFILGKVEIDVTHHIFSFRGTYISGALGFIPVGTYM